MSKEKLLIHRIESVLDDYLQDKESATELECVMQDAIEYIKDRMEDEE